MCVWSGLRVCSVRPCAPRGRTRLVLPHSPDMPQQVSSAEGTRPLRGPQPPAQAPGLLLGSVWDGHPEGVAGAEAAEPRQEGGSSGSQGPQGGTGSTLGLLSPPVLPVPCLSPPQAFCPPLVLPALCVPLHAWLAGADADETGPVLGSGPRAGVGVLSPALEVLLEGSLGQRH